MAETRRHSMSRLDMYQDATSFERYLGALFGQPPASLAIHRIAGNKYVQRVHLDDGMSFPVDTTHLGGSRIPSFRLADTARQEIRTAWADTLAEADYADWQDTRRDAALVGAP